MARYDLLIINRSFWPIYPVIGESLLRLAEKLAPKKKVAIVMQDHVGIKKELQKNNRGIGIKFFPSWAISTSSSNILIRVLDAIFFMFWVTICLIITRPKDIYVSTDPPVIVPFVVAVYSKIFKSKFIYHIQDIHPEATNIVIKLNSTIYKLLKKIDIFTIKQADLLITLTNQMKNVIIKRTNTKKNIFIIENPSIPFEQDLSSIKKNIGFSFTGNLGRLQRIPLLLNAIKIYSNNGGKLNFYFAGSGIYAESILKNSKIISLINYKGVLSPEDSALLSSKYEWALLPIEDDVLNYAFPSKTSSYVFSGAKILAICGESTNVANWIKNNKLGFVVPPKISQLVDFFFKIEKQKIDLDKLNLDRKELKKRLHINLFIKNLNSVIYSVNDDKTI